jgi:hypothetical protein
MTVLNDNAGVPQCQKMIIWGELVAPSPARQGRARPGHPRLCRVRKSDVDARDEPGHDDGCVARVGSAHVAPDSKHTFSISRRGASEVCISCPSENQRVQEKPGARCTRSLVRKVESTRVSHHRFTGTPGLSCAMVLRLISSSPRGPGLFVPVIGVMRSTITNLTPASGRQDHTTSPSARIALSSLAPPASIASRTQRP